VAKLLAGELEHGGDPVLLWAASSVVAKPVKPDRLQSANRIDPFVATLMALDCAERMEAKPPRRALLNGQWIANRKGCDRWPDETRG